MCQHKRFWRGTKCSQIFGLAQKIWTSTKRFGTCKRTRHFYALSFYRFCAIQIFCVGPKIYLHIASVTKNLCQTKRWFSFSKMVFCAVTKVFEEVLNAVKFLGWHKKIGVAQNILGPVKGQVISIHIDLLMYILCNNCQ